MHTTTRTTTTELLRVIRAGERICTVRRDAARMVRGQAVWTGGIYEARVRRRDGLLTWRLVGTFGPRQVGAYPSRRFCEQLRAVAPHRWAGWLRHGELVLPGIA